MNEEIKIYSIDEVLDSIGGYIDCSEFMDDEEDYQYSNIVYYLEKYKEQQEEIDRLNNIINEADTKNLELIQKINKIYDIIENKNITGIEARLLIQNILDKEE